MDKHQTVKQAIVNTVKLANLLLSDLSLVLKDYGLSEPQYNVLRILRGAGKESLNLFQIRERMIQASSNTTRLIVKLKNKGLVATRTCPGNRRKVEVNISSKGLKLLKQFDPEMKKFEAKIAEKMSVDDAITLNALLNKLIEQYLYNTK